MDFTIFDFIIIGLIGLSALVGLFRGFFRELFSLIVWFVALLGALKLAQHVMHLFSGFITSEKLQYAVAVIALFFIIWVVGSIVASLLSRALRSVGLGLLDRLLGFIFGAARGVLLVVVMILVSHSSTFKHKAWAKDSVLAPHFQPVVGHFEVMIPLKYAAIMKWVNKTVVV